jgi:hypothetical protein
MMMPAGSDRGDETLPAGTGNAPAELESRLSELYAEIRQMREQMAGDAAVIAYLRRESDERLTRLARQLDELAAPTTMVP